MSSIQNRFSGLQLDIRNPTDVVKPKRSVKNQNKIQKKNAQVNEDPTKKVVKQKGKESELTSPNIQPKTVEDKPAPSQKILSDKLTQKNVAGEQKSEAALPSVKDNSRVKQQTQGKNREENLPRNLGNTPHDPELVVDLDGEEATGASVRYYDKRRNDESVDDFQGDNRGFKPRRAYQKMALTSGRMFERHSGLNTGVRSQEKRHGRGKFNWGDQSDDQQINYSKDQSRTNLEGDSALDGGSEKDGEGQKNEYTLNEYRAYVKDNKIAPRYRGDEVHVKSSEKKIEEKTQSRGASRSRFRTRDGRDGYSRGDFHHGGEGEVRQTHDGEPQSGYRRGSYPRRFHNSNRGHSGEILSESKNAIDHCHVVNLDIDDFAHFPQL